MTTVVILSLLILTMGIWLYFRSDIFIRVSILLIIAIIIPDVWVLVHARWPETENITINVWFSKSYREYLVKEKQELSVLWYIYGVGSYVSKVLFAYCFSKVAALISFRLFKVSVIVVIFHIIQFAFWLWNKNTSVWSNYLVYLFIILIIIHLIIPDKRQAKYRVMEHYD